MLLKRSAKRTTRLEHAASDDGAPRVVKRYHSPGPLDRRLDRRRAQREFRLLVELARRGLPVPRPVEVRERDGAWELVTEWIPDTVTLEDVLRGRARLARSLESCAPALGAALARAHALGLDHRDLHPGNVLMQPDGGAWLVDVRAARLRASIGRRQRWRDLVVLAAALRERTTERFRARALASYLHAAGPAIASALVPGIGRGQLGYRLELSARQHRRAVLEHGRLRWTRASSVSRPLEEAGLAGFVACGLTEAQRKGCIALARTIAGSSGGQGERLAVPGVVEEVALCRAGTWNELLAAWYACARLFEHALPAARPALLLRHPRPIAMFLLPRDVRTWSGAWSTASTQGREQLARALGELAGALLDRVLPHAGDLEALYVDAAPRVWITGTARLFDPAARRASRDPGINEQMLGSMTLRERAQFYAGTFETGGMHHMGSLSRYRRARAMLKQGLESAGNG